MPDAKTLLLYGGLLVAIVLSVITWRGLDRLDARLASEDRALEQRLEKLLQDDLRLSDQAARSALEQETATAVQRETAPLGQRLESLGRQIDALAAAQKQARTAAVAQDSFLAALDQMRQSQQDLDQRLALLDQTLANLRGGQDTLRHQLAQRLRTELEDAATANEDRMRELMDVRGGAMVEIPPGSFVMGADAGKAHEQPAHEVFIDGFRIDRYEVTNAEYAAFVSAAGHRQPDCTSQSRPWTEWDGALLPRGYDNHPTVCVSWADARAFCEWAGKRLPTEAEWERAARGEDGRAYPWGDALTPELEARFANKPKDSNKNDRKPFPAVGSYTTDTSPYGASDMSGSVMEWVWDYYDSDYYARSEPRNPQGPAKAVNTHLLQKNKSYVLRGGWWSYKDTDLRVLRRQAMGEHHRLNYVGFRCAASI